MGRITLIILACLFLCVNSSHAENDNPDYEKVSALLFPDTSNWTPISKMQITDEKFLRKIEPKLRMAYTSSKIDKDLESEDCSFIGRAFSKNYDFPKYFYLDDVDGDVFVDVIYTGSAQCTEGDVTLIWFGTKDGYVVKQDTLWPMLALRIKKGSPEASDSDVNKLAHLGKTDVGCLLISSVAVGCCASEIDEYFVGPLINLRMGGSRNITKGTIIPVNKEQTVPFTSNNELVLRSSPELNDTYNENASGRENIAVFGNVLTKYLPGCSGNIVGRQKDKRGRLWYFVIIVCGPLRTHVPYNVSAGWIDSASVSSKP